LVEVFFSVPAVVPHCCSDGGSSICYTATDDDISTLVERFCDSSAAEIASIHSLLENSYVA